MSSGNGKIFLTTPAIALFLLLILPQKILCQSQSILDSTFTFNEGTITTGKALDIISRQSGYNFSYDSRLIEQERLVDLNFNLTKLKAILDSILNKNSLVFSVIDKYIIVSLPAPKQQPSFDSVAPNIHYITGSIRDEENAQPLSFATIALKNNGKGTVTNINGEFGLKISPDLLNDTLSVSFLGFMRREIPVRNAIGNILNIEMKREFISIPEIIIKSQNPQDIVYKALRAIPRNYGSSPAAMTAFYREGVMKKSQLQTYSEAILQIYKSSYSGTLLNDQIKVYKSRKLENTDRRDTLAIRLRAGLSTCLELDGARNLYDFLTNMKDYKYRMTDIVTYDNESAYAIEFEQQEYVDLPLFKGIIYINTSDFGILNAEFEINPKLISKLRDTFVSPNRHGFNTRPSSVKYTVNYRKMNDRYFLNHVRGDLVFVSSQKRKLFHSQFKVFFELAVTEVELTNVHRFDREELAPIHSVFSRTIKSYDPDFWGNQNFLRPEDNLMQELKNMNVKLQEFSE